MPVELVTQPNYVVLHAYAAAMLCFGLGGVSIFTLVGQSFLLWFPAAFVLNLFGMFVLWNYPVGAAAGASILAWTDKSD